MARKRGGLAGFWDRKKQYIVPAASGLAGMFGGPLAGAAVGSLARGLDKRNLKAGLQGGLEGYGAGALGAGLGAKIGVGEGSRAAVKRFLSPKAASAVAPKAAAPMDALNMDLGLGKQAMVPMSGGRMPAMSGGMDFLPTTSLPPEPQPSPFRRAGSAVKSAATSALDTAAKYEKPLGMLVEGVAGGVPSAEVETARARNVLDERRFEEELRLQKIKEERQALLAELLMPILSSRLNERGFGQEGYQGVASMQGAVPGFGTYTSPPRSAPRAMSSVSQLQSSVAPSRSSVSPLRSTVSPLRR